MKKLTKHLEKYMSLRSLSSDTDVSMKLTTSFPINLNVVKVNEVLP